MSKHFRPWNIDQTLLLPPIVRDFVPKDHVSRFIVGLVRESLDLKAIMGSYVSGLGQPPFDPRMMRGRGEGRTGDRHEGSQARPLQSLSVVLPHAAAKKVHCT
jgi:hypothetical protein